MSFLPQALFLVLFTGAVWLFTKKAKEIRRNILLGIDEDLTDRPAERWKNVLLLALGQKKMFRNLPVAIMHLIIYAGFIIINIEVLEIVLDGIWGTHRLFLEPLGMVYPLLINTFEVLALLVVVVCVIFLIRRNALKIKRFLSNDLNGWPKSDANYILITEIVLMGLFLTMNATDRALQLQGAEHYKNTGDFLVSGWLVPAFQQMSVPSLIALERSAWWLHIIGILAFLNYLPWSKHLHIILAFPNAWYGRLTNISTMRNMPEVANEVKYMFQPELAPAEATPPSRFGAKDIFDLSWKSLLDAYSCTECGRCSAACPANTTGKLLSPRKIMMDTRDRLEEVGRNINQNGSFKDDGKTLLHQYITVEELRACTTCNACVDACPVSINPLNIITELRRSLIMEESNAPGEWNAMFSNIENNYAPWKFSPEDRGEWAK